MPLARVMKLSVLSLLLFAYFSFGGPGARAQAADQPLRVFIRAGAKTHGPGQHDHPRFLNEWRKLLEERGAKADGSMEFPSAAQLEQSDVLVLYAPEGGTMSSDERERLARFLKRGGGLVVIHDAVCGTDPHWFKTVVGGAWEHGHAKWLEGDVGLYFIEQNHPITRGVSNFDLKDEIYYELHMMPGAKVLATSFHDAFTIAPQLWVYEKENYRAFVCIPGHEFSTFNLPHMRAILLRGMAWVARRNADLLVSQTELASLAYPEGGPTAPEKAAARIRVPADFDLRLAASEPLIEKPISMDWDPQGRLWVAETPEYPNGRKINRNDEVIAPWRDHDPKTYSGGIDSRPARDRISILTDSDGDGRMDQKTVFYEGLELVTSLVFYRDGVIVSQAPEILWLRDTDHDGKADKREVLFTGFGTSDTHAVISNMRWGMDGWIYATQGYSGAEPKSPDGKRNFGRLGSGVLRFKPDGSAIEMVSSKNGNTWGLDFGWDGELFFTQANGTHLQHVVLPEAALARGRMGNTASYKTIEDHRKVFPAITHKKHPYLQIDNVGGFTASSGSAVYTGGAWPERFDYTHFVSEPTVNLVHLDRIKPLESSYLASKDQEEEFIASTDLWFRPIHQRIGPDGALYLLDFYNQAVVHNDTRGPKHGANNAAVRPDRDHHFGRIWRVQFKEPRPLPPARLASATGLDLVGALEHPNGWVRETAHRLLLENSLSAPVREALERLALSTKAPAARVRALWLLEHAGDSSSLVKAITDADPAVRKNALQIAALPGPAGAESSPLLAAVRSRLTDLDARARLQALLALARFMDQPAAQEAVVEVFPRLNDSWLQSAAVSAAAAAPDKVLSLVLSGQFSGGLTNLVAELSKIMAAKAGGVELARLVETVAAAPEGHTIDQEAVLSSLAANRDGAVAPWSAQLQEALRRLLSSGNLRLSGAALPLIARWDSGRRMSADVSPVIRQLVGQLSENGRSEAERGQTIRNLLGVYELDPGIIQAIGQWLRTMGPGSLQSQTIAALGDVRDPAVGAEFVAAYPELSSGAQGLVFNQLIRRVDWAGSLLDAIQAGKVAPLSLGPGALHRLRTHPDGTIAQRATELLDALRGPEVKEKDALIAKFAPLVQKTGSAEAGKKLFSENCAVCHKLNGEGRDLAPDLTGMGVHAPAELLVHILDPNRVVEPNFISTSIETRDDESIDGIIARENNAGVVLRNAAGDFEIKREKIKSQRSTGLSLMPNGFEALGPDGLRDILTYLGAGQGKYRTIDLGPAFTANSTRGIFSREEAADETLKFRKFGLVNVGEVPFEISSPARHAEGKNIVVLKGGQGFAQTLPQKVECRPGVAAAKLHFLSGVGGWAFPWGAAGANKLPVLKVTVHYADHQTEEFVFKNGEEFADYNGSAEVPGSRAAPDLVKAGQVRYFTRVLKSGALMERLTMESYGNAVAPAVVAITAEAPASAVSTAGTVQLAALPGTGERNTATDAPGVAGLPMNKRHVLIVGGGSSHDFGRWFNQADSETLRALGNVEVTYTEQVDQIAPQLAGIDVLYLSNNQPMTNQVLRDAIFQFVSSGKGLLLVHPALWYNWKDWPEYNRVLVGGGAKSHDKYGEFDVTVGDSSHPIMKGVSKNFKITDELYHFVKDAHGSPIKALASGKGPESDSVFPVVWTVQPPKGRVVCITLGHDAKAHEHPDYKRILQNSLLWVIQPEGAAREK